MIENESSQTLQETLLNSKNQECSTNSKTPEKENLKQKTSEKEMDNEKKFVSTSGCETESSSSKKTDSISSKNGVSTFLVDNDKNEEELLKKKRKVKYNMITKRFEVEGGEENLPEITNSDPKKDKKLKIVQKYGKETKTYDLANPADCRMFQLDSFLNFKRKIPEQAKESQCVYHETSDISCVNMNDFCKDIQAILINPPWRSEGVNAMDKIKSLQLPLKAMKEGIIFIWVEKEFLAETLQFFEDQNIKYVENMVWAKLTNLKNKKSNNTTDYFDIRDMYVNDEYEYFAKSKLTLLLFRKFQENSQRSLELRHQRSGDAVFDFIDEKNPNYVPNEYAFKLIETLLPKANFKENSNFKMVEVWGQKGYKRKGWVHFVECAN